MCGAVFVGCNKKSFVVLNFKCANNSNCLVATFITSQCTLLYIFNFFIKNFNDVYINSNDHYESNSDFEKRNKSKKNDKNCQKKNKNM